MGCAGGHAICVKYFLDLLLYTWTIFFNVNPNMTFFPYIKFTYWIAKVQNRTQGKLATGPENFALRKLVSILIQCIVFTKYRESFSPFFSCCGNPDREFKSRAHKIPYIFVKF